MRIRSTHAAALAAALLATLVALRHPGIALGQQLGEGMDRSGTVGIRSDAERQIFEKLICTCGCPREALSTCTCGFAEERREEVRAMMAQGMNMEAIEAAYAKAFGMNNLAVPPNSGSARFVWMIPLLSIAAMAAFVGLTLRRFRRRSDGASPPPGEPKGGGEETPKDKYDEKLDDELDRLDEEDR
jgi:cytochrome c-type biogenesis protein CcmH